MDDGVDDEVMAISEAEGIHLQRKEGDFMLKPECYNLLDEREVLLPSDTGYSSSSHEVFAGILDGKNLSRNADALDKFEPRYMGEGGSMVEELTVKNDNSSNLAIVGTSTKRKRVLTGQSQWLRPYCPGRGGSGSGNLLGEVHWGGLGQEILGASADNAHFPESLAQNPCSQEINVIKKNSENNEKITVSCDRFPPGGVQTKVFSKSGFSEFFSKNSLRGKGVVSGVLVHDGCDIESGQQSDTNVVGHSKDSSFCLLSSNAKTALPSCGGVTDSLNDGTSLRAWLNAGLHKANKIESLYIFRKILTLVNFSHSQGAALQDLRPSCFYLLPSNQVKYMGRYVQREILNKTLGEDTLPNKDNISGKRQEEHGLFPHASLRTNRKKFADRTNVTRCQSPFLPRPGTKLQTDIFYNDINAEGGQFLGDEGCREQNSNKKCKPLKRSSSPMSRRDQNQKQLVSVNDWLEDKWYTSPEEVRKRSCTLSSNIYHLGVLLFELLSSFDSAQVHVAAMSDLNQRILPPQFLSEFPREAGFCLWLLHPEPSSRPTTREILQSVVIHELQNACGDELSTSIEQDDMESELLMHFLLELKEIKQKRASKLEEDIKYLEGDIGEVEKRCLSNTPLVSRGICHSARGSKFLQKGPSSPEALRVFSSPSSTSDLRLMKKWSQLENAYFSMRSKIKPPIADDIPCSDGGNREKIEDPLGAFFDGLCKYARYSNFEVRGTLRNGDFINSANVICSLCFDRDEDYFAAAGISKKIKIYDFHALLSDSVDIHYPAVEMVNRSRLSCICWNNYIKNYLASTDYDGIVKVDSHELVFVAKFIMADDVFIEAIIVGLRELYINILIIDGSPFPCEITNGLGAPSSSPRREFNVFDFGIPLWDVSTGQCFSQYIEHQKRSWSVDFSRMDPTRLVSGSDDNSVKLWSINEKNCLGTVKSKANVCCVQFSANFPHLIAFGSSNFYTYCYDLRNVRTPWCTLAGHDKAVSYVKFLDSKTLVSASIDNTLKLWDLNKISSSDLSTEACTLTMSGHTNEKNFVGLSVCDGYIACGSETNEVYAYHRSMPMPIAFHRFGSIDPISGKETDDDFGKFVSSVCWGRKSGMVVAANSSGCIKVLQMV